MIKIAQEDFDYDMFAPTGGCKWHRRQIDRPGRQHKAERLYRRNKTHFGKKITLRDYRGTKQLREE